MAYKIHSRTGLFVSKSGKVKGHIRLAMHRKGYIMVVYKGRPNRKTGKPTRRRLFLHRLVAETYLGFSRLHVNHKNGIKTDNRLRNLEYVTRAENAVHAHATGLINAKGESNGRAKLTEKDVRRILSLDPGSKEAGRGPVSREVADDYGLHYRYIQAIWLRKSWAHL